MERGECPDDFSTGKSAQERGLSHVPKCYMVPPSQRPNFNSPLVDMPVIDLSGLCGEVDPVRRSAVIDDIGRACRQHGFFQVINHGISQSVLDNTLHCTQAFFNLPAAEKLKLTSDDVHKPVRYGTSLRDGVDKVQFWRVFLKHYAHPLDNWIQTWPENPPTYRKDMGIYTTEVRKLAIQLMGAITESLGLGPSYLNTKYKMDDGVHLMALNCYPPCPEPSLTLGLPPHSDYTCLTILFQSSPGLEILDPKDNSGKWKRVLQLKGALQVHIGDHFEVLSNGIYKSVVHRVTLNRDGTRVSIASLHSMGMDEKMKPAPELVNTEYPKGYRESSFKDFLNFLSKNDIAQGITFLDSLKLKN